MSSICVTIPDNVLYLLIIGSVSAIISAFIGILNIPCPFISNLIQMRTINRNTGLLHLMNEQMAISRIEATSGKNTELRIE